MDMDQFFEKHPELRIVADYVIEPPSPEELTAEFGYVPRDVIERCDELMTYGAAVTRGCVFAARKRSGQSTDFAAMIAMQKSSGISTTDTFWSGRKPFWSVYGQEYADRVRKSLAARGISLGANGEYMPELARFEGDPEAVVPFSGSRDYIRGLCERRGWGCNGAVNVKAREPGGDPLSDDNCVPMAEDLVIKNASRMIRENPDLGRKTKAEVRQMVLDKYGPSR